MNLPKDLLRELGKFHQVNPEKLDGIDEYTEWLESILHNSCSIWEKDGKEFIIEIRRLVKRVNGLKIEIYSNEHPPPRFHVKSPNVNASFSIENCEKIDGKVSTQDHGKIRYWHKTAKKLLIDAWNDTRPINCTVGCYKDI